MSTTSTLSFDRETLGFKHRSDFRPYEMTMTLYKNDVQYGTAILIAAVHRGTIVMYNVSPKDWARPFGWIRCTIHTDAGSRAERTEVELIRLYRPGPNDTIDPETDAYYRCAIPIAPRWLESAMQQL